MKKWKWFVAFILCLTILVVTKLEENGRLNSHVSDFVYGSKDLQIMREVLRELFGNEKSSKIFVSSEMMNEDLLTYNQVTPYESGFLFAYDKNFPILAIDDGLVVYTGHSKKLGKTISIYYNDDTTVTYGYIDAFSILPYTTIEKGKTIANSVSGKLYIRVEKDNKIYDLKETLSWLKESNGSQ